MARSLRQTSAALGAGLLLTGLSAPFAPAAMAEVLVRAQGRCKLISGGYPAFNGHCTFKHKKAGNIDAYVVKLDDGTEFNFSGPNAQALSVQTYDGIRSVSHRARRTMRSSAGTTANPAGSPFGSTASRIPTPVSRIPPRRLTPARSWVPRWVP